MYLLLHQLATEKETRFESNVRSRVLVLRKLLFFSLFDIVVHPHHRVV